MEDSKFLEGKQLPIYRLFKRTYDYSQKPVGELDVSYGASNDYWELDAMIYDDPESETVVDEFNYFIDWIVESEDQAFDFLVKLLPTDRPINSSDLLECYQYRADIAFIYDPSKVANEWESICHSLGQRLQDHILNLPNAPTSDEIEEFKVEMGK